MEAANQRLDEDTQKTPEGLATCMNVFIGLISFCTGLALAIIVAVRTNQDCKNYTSYMAYVILYASCGFCILSIFGCSFVKIKRAPMLVKYFPTIIMTVGFCGLFILTQVFFFGQNDCLKNWTSAYVLILIWIIFGYIFALTFACMLFCCSIYVIAADSLAFRRLVPAN